MASAQRLTYDFFRFLQLPLVHQRDGIESCLTVHLAISLKRQRSHQPVQVIVHGPPGILRDSNAQQRPDCVAKVLPELAATRPQRIADGLTCIKVSFIGLDQGLVVCSNQPDILCIADPHQRGSLTQTGQEAVVVLGADQEAVDHLQLGQMQLAWAGGLAFQPILKTTGL